MSRTKYRNNVPPGLIAQIVVAVIITLGAIFVLPTALSARSTIDQPQTIPAATPSAGTVAVTVKDFTASSFAASAFSDWD